MRRKILCISMLILVIINAFSVTQAVNYSSNTNSYYNNTNYKYTYNSTSTYSSSKSAKESTPSVDTSKKIYDYAELFTSEEESKLYDSVQNFINETNFDMVIVTIDDNNKSSSMAYADDFYDYNNFGIDEKNSGILFLIDMDNRKMWISTTGEAMTMYTNTIINSILDDCYDYISNENYYECANTFASLSLKEYKNKINSKWIIGGIIIAVVSIGCPTVFCLYQKSKHKAIKLAKDADDYLDRNSINILDETDRFVSTHTTKIRRSSSSSGSGGGTHIGSSGVSHGGGGRSF